jgi:hypothetical protein
MVELNININDVATETTLEEINVKTPALVGGKVPVELVYGELIEAIEAIRMAIQSLNRTIGLAQVNPLTGGLFVDGSRVTQPISGNLGTLTTLTTLNNLLQMGGQNTNSIPLSTERNAADNLRNNIKIT